MRALALALGMLVLPAAAADGAARCAKALFTPPCKDVQVMTEPPGAAVQFQDRWGMQTCTSPCTVSLRWGEEVDVYVKLRGHTVADEPGRVRWAMHGLFGRDALTLEPNPIAFKLREAPRGLRGLVFHILHRGPHHLEIDRAKGGGTPAVRG